MKDDAIVHVGFPAFSVILCAIDWPISTIGSNVGEGYSSMASAIARSEPLEFFLRGHLKELVHRDAVTTQTDLVVRLHAAELWWNTALHRGAHSFRLLLAHACLNIHDGHFQPLQ
ncbi:hypothetical protein TNCV_3977231 [Trichonephila clavipes]|nr:hypothetical protein TNCV_3977231 [Trichonephila clavipes]